MKRQYDLIVFDWEGTIGEDSFGHVVNVLSQEASRLHFGEFDKSLARRYITFGIAGAIKQLFPQLLMYHQEQLVAAAQDALSASASDIYLIEGAEKLIRQIHEAGLKLAIATNKGPIALQRTLQTTGLDTYFKVTRSAGPVPPKPCPQMLEEIIDEMNSLPEKTLMIGDSTSDIEMARSLGVDAIGIDLYNVQREELLAVGAKHVFETYKQITDYLNLSGGSK
ncbi:MAG: HAD family hydrolase [Legionellaceae bacterium]|nr:HAD family hydrolase [Legionellaceae bacterium]